MQTIYIDFVTGNVTTIRAGIPFATLREYAGVSDASLARLHRYFWRNGCKSWAIIHRDDRLLRFGWCESQVVSK